MRVGTMQLFNQGVSAMLDQQSQLLKTQLQLATGKRIINPSDDPTGAAELIGLSELSTITRQYQTNSDQLRARLEFEDTALNAVADDVQRVRELAVRGLNDTNGASERTAMALEIRQILEEVVGLANSKNANGEYMFAGYQVQDSPFADTGGGVFTYAGDSGQRQIQIGPERRIADGDSGQSVFLDIPSSGGGTESIFATLNSLATALEANAPNAASLDQLDNVLDHIVGVQARVGARLNAVDSQGSVNTALMDQLEVTRSDIEDLDYAEAASRLSQQSVALQAAQQAFVRVQGLSLFDFI